MRKAKVIWMARAKLTFLKETVTLERLTVKLMARSKLTFLKGQSHKKGQK